MLMRHGCTGATTGRIACHGRKNLAWLAVILVVLPVIGADAATWRGISVADEQRCSAYDRGSCRYPARMEAEIIRSQTGMVNGPYTGRTFESPKQTGIEHIVALSEAHDSGLCAVTPAVQRQFAANLLNLTLAAPEVNRNGRINCKEARRHGIAPVAGEHPAYRFMWDGDNDGVVCE